MNKINYNSELEVFLKDKKSEGIRPRVLLHCCCAPCSSYCLLFLSEYCDITAFFYNPNIDTEDEYIYRREELKRYINEAEFSNKVDFVEVPYEKSEYYNAVRGYESEPEGGKRCEQCFKLRLSKTAEFASEMEYDYFMTTLTISPLKDAELINKIGFESGNNTGIVYLPSDFKKNNGYKRSIELSKEYNLYRQNYCGCGFSK